MLKLVHIYNNIFFFKKMDVIAPSPMIAPSLVYKVWMVNFITTMLKLQSISNRIYKNKIISTIENDNKKNVLQWFL